VVFREQGGGDAKGFDFFSDVSEFVFFHPQQFMNVDRRQKTPPRFLLGRWLARNPKHKVCFFGWCHFRRRTYSVVAQSRSTSGDCPSA
jgi:hypothetical protein